MQSTRYLWRMHGLLSIEIPYTLVSSKVLATAIQSTKIWLKGMLFWGTLVLMCLCCCKELWYHLRKMEVRPLSSHITLHPNSRNHSIFLLPSSPTSQVTDRQDCHRMILLQNHDHSLVCSNQNQLALYGLIRPILYFQASNLYILYSSHADTRGQARSMLRKFLLIFMGRLPHSSSDGLSLC